MNHNPFYSINTNLYDESFRSSAPTNINGENVILSQEQQRKVWDTFNTAIVGFSANQPMLCAQKNFLPGGVMFTFPSSNAAQGQSCRCSMYQPQAPPQAAVNNFFPSSVEYSQLNPCGFQQPSKQPFNLQFHRNNSTSTSDLLPPFPTVPGPRAILGEYPSTSPKSCQQCQTMHELMFPSPPIDFSSQANKLVLTKWSRPPAGHVVDVLEPVPDEKKNVSFSPPTTKEEGIQMTSDCICEAKKCKGKSKKRNSKAHSQIQRDSSFAESQSDGESSEGETKYKKKHCWNFKRTEQSSDNENTRTGRGRRKKRPTKSKHNLKKEEELGSCLSSEELSLMLNSSNTSTGSDECRCP